MSASAAKIIGVLATGILLCVSGISLAQEAGSAALETVSNEVAPAPAVASEPAATETASVEAPSVAAAPAHAASVPKDAMAPQWIWGEVVSVDKASNQVQIKHLDYDTYEEVTKVIQTDTGTLYENVAGIGELKAGDSVTVDFKLRDGAQVAELIVVDKNRTMSESTAPAQAPAAAPEEVAVPPALQEAVVAAPAQAPTPPQEAPALPDQRVDNSAAPSGSM